MNSSLSIDVRVVEIDAPFFKELARQEQPLTLYFTNSKTVEGTLARLHKSGLIKVETIVIPDAFDLLMAGNKTTHDKIIKAVLMSAPKNAAVAQLSMVDVAEELGILHPLTALVEAIVGNE